MSEHKPSKQSNYLEEHLATLDEARIALRHSMIASKILKKRLENAMKKYEERGKIGPSKHI